MVKRLGVYALAESQQLLSLRRIGHGSKFFGDRGLPSPPYKWASSPNACSLPSFNPARWPAFGLLRLQFFGCKVQQQAAGVDPIDRARTAGQPGKSDPNVQ